GDLEPASGDDVAADKSGQGDPGTSYVGLDVRLRPDQDVCVRLDLAAEVPKQLPCALHHELAGQAVFADHYRRFRVESDRSRPPHKPGEPAATVALRGPRRAGPAARPAFRVRGRPRRRYRPEPGP